MNYIGTILEESLSDKSVLKEVKILKQKVEPVSEKSKTPWVTKWTHDYVEIAEGQADEIAHKLSQAIEFEHESSWYADYLNNQTHYIIFKNKVFKIDRGSKEQYDAAFDYGLSVGIPEYQLITFESQKQIEGRRKAKYDQ
ncbi:MAG: hypothetical protein A3J07_01250 [Candidatus Doudnabacteria bacterium RIFCSPLOWO2_02_FULL_49_13]|uniref:Uncharacterized protein n=1 Tax=Candidatus Doudnabacteria bacterium RIFCSPHIGHO2_12_FULL_48_16 TaxID=1817838 RepID=A0A1F5PK93_9BACT|nr:MAG: hypothetical protein A3B77_04180 [Candidatus Doudnabacteria bacterium RIFCSPHIGHO2_02_FULL_49_24]OGE88680.1 MAG: hypothetical protein A2760_01840 [Candidatus Doudnabacteria bacterium RIFCSPHIGHO2_01_FULL_50_67]OGE90365.1 MAG: hypothetical protein A3E29_04760 [Candidatus Doudnabacteria bacterium RIFCSPHIGHO2_12_FULL_48_16]OGE97072.1 MAG: hypothetical protein A2990_01750 [Candidatus Doudnabacteria bacterium RIFCSPLOWO2_01_FULL_49_40]OGF02421.1 MAG: hypothetical protein A3J07_01250 [Candid